ncbi:hypothetical protein [Natrialbaceae archaeon AArc-T1-2]|uniref:hypothetical protein n=1 Tax=Natrialbaceae archaeon AArc-T1-2 TaxID=3053904 RepID=UPI00255ACACD|nr:hypothetical protein [Natrialbaceae archaeon AArc-T1-2]WIV65652.1 hypothetical protein QQ977_08020 [Natrialbaceae archaeon AArc-T1-2]
MTERVDSSDGVGAGRSDLRSRLERWLAGVRSRLEREWRLWLEFAPAVPASVGYLLVVWLLVPVTSLQVGLLGTGVWLLAALVWIVLGRRSESTMERL